MIMLKRFLFPTNPNGVFISVILLVVRIVFGILLGILTAVFRVFGPNAEGVSYAIIFCNLLVPIVEKYTVPKMFGAVKKKKEA